MLELLIGLTIGSLATYKIVGDRIADYKHFAELRIKDYKESFKIGFESQHGHQPFREESAVNEVHSTDEDFGTFNGEDYYSELPVKRERWDD